MSVRRSIVFSLLCCCSAFASADPVTSDPEPKQPPPSMASVRIPSGDALLNGIIYLPGGPGPHPVAFVLHGLPGDERNLDLAHALRRDDWAVVFFHYRGAWGSPGAFSFEHVLEDVAAAVDWSLGDETRARFRLDDRDRTLVGHSMGGFAALSAGAVHPEVGCIASIAGANMSQLARAAEADPSLRPAYVEALGGYAAGPLAGTSGEAMVTELETQVDAWDLAGRVPDLAAHRLLMVAGARDVVAAPAIHHEPLLAALLEADADVTSVVLEDDHAFSASRIALARELATWLSEDCR